MNLILTSGFVAMVVRSGKASIHVSLGIKSTVFGGLLLVRSEGLTTAGWCKTPAPISTDGCGQRQWLHRGSWLPEHIQRADLRESHKNLALKDFVLFHPSLLTNLSFHRLKWQPVILTAASSRSKSFCH